MHWKTVRPERNISSNVVIPSLGPNHSAVLAFLHSWPFGHFRPVKNEIKRSNYFTVTYCSDTHHMDYVLFLQWMVEARKLGLEWDLNPRLLDALLSEWVSKLYRVFKKSPPPFWAQVVVPWVKSMFVWWSTSTLKLIFQVSRKFFLFSIGYLSVRW